jgi:hypothetical protein
MAEILATTIGPEVVPAGVVSHQDDDVGLSVCAAAWFAPHVTNTLEKAIAQSVSFLEGIAKSMSLS